MTVHKKATRGAKTPQLDSSAASETGPQAFFGFSHKPFALTPDPAFLYRSHTHGPAVDSLLDAIRQLDGLLVLTGEIGTGKTTVCRTILRELEASAFTAMALDPLASREDFLKTLLIEFGVIPMRDVKGGRLHTSSRAELHFQLREFLRSLGRSKATAVVIVDEAHNLAPALWEEVRILCDMHSEDSPVHVVLVGLPTLSPRLQEPDVCGIDQRVALRCQLEPITSDEMAAFVSHRVQVARPRRSCEFTAEAVDVVFRETRGVPRLISLLCDRAVHEAALRRTGVIEADVVQTAAARLEASLSAVRVRRSDDFNGPLGDWLTHLEHAVDRTAKAPMEMPPPPSEPELRQRTSLLKRLFR